jgi:replicative DNA helicase
LAGSELLDRIPPNNLEAERAALGAAILDKNALYTALEILSAEDFYEPRHGMAFDVIKGLTRRDMAVDEVTCQEEMTRLGLWERVGGAAFAAALVDAVATAANIEHYCNIVKDKSVHRALIRAGAEITKIGYAEETESADAMSEAEQKVFDIARRGSKNSFKEIDDVVRKVFNQIEKNCQEGAPTTSIMSGFADFDRLTDGFQPGSLNIIAARPSVGKTALALNIATCAGVEQNTPTLIFTLEMSAEQIVSRMLSALASVNIREMQARKRIENSDWTALTDAASRLDVAPITVDDSHGLSAFEIRTRCRRFMSRHLNKKCLVIIDYLQLIASESRRKENRNEEVAEISRMLKGVAREFGVPVIALSQLSRDVEKRGEGKRPLLSDLRDSGAIEQDADIVAFLYRKSYQNLDSEDNTAELAVQKNRNGPTGAVNLVFYREFSRFESGMSFKM